jgi:endonuclease/exonuclease/phosphatase family metal-dependent hydrolase
MLTARLLPAWVLATAFALAASADQAPINIDGQFDDWNGVPAAYTDTIGDGGSLDFVRLWLADDDRFFFMRVELTQEWDSGENNSVRIYLDTDNNAATGLSIAGIGAELEWRLGDRAGTFYRTGGSTTVDQADLRFRGAPTVTGTTFEFAFGRDVRPDGSHQLFTGSTLRIALQSGGGADRMPNSGEFVTYTLDQGSAPPPTPIALERSNAGDLRLVTNNVHSDSPWNSGQEPRFGRQLAAIDPDIVCFQEVYNHSPSECAALVGRWVTLDGGQSWHAAGVSDCKIVSRFPILNTWSLDSNIAALIDTTAATGSHMLLIDAHLPCCTNDSGRQSEIDRIMAFVRDAKATGGVLTLQPDTPIVITGDLNLVGYAQQLVTLLTGDIVDQGQFGSDFTPDWDGSDFTSVYARQTELRMGYTWRSDTSDFWPGQLDFIIWSDSAIGLGNHYILYTPEMSPTNLSNYGLLATDSEASDHLMFVTDFSVAPPFEPGDMNCDGTINTLDIEPFVLALTEPNAYELNYPDCDINLADINSDGVINTLDIEAFIALLTGP